MPQRFPLYLAIFLSLSLCPLLANGPFDDPQQCQSFDDGPYSTPSDRYWSMLSADDFVADGSPLSQARVWGFYYKFDLGGDCAPPLTFDHFEVRIFENDPVTGSKPGTIFAQSAATAQHLAVADSQIESPWGSVMYQIDLALVSPISGLVAGQVYWLEVSNSLTNSSGQPAFCTWYWSLRNQASTSFYWFSTGESSCSSTVAEPSPFDAAFCLNFDLGQSPVGSTPSACCTCDGVCSERTLKSCEDAGGEWDVDQASCGGGVCPPTFANDNCVDGPPLVGEGEYTIPKTCATTDGFGPIQTDFGSDQIAEDVWYKFIAPQGCQLMVSMCATNPRCFDSMVAVYHNPGDPTVCPPCALMGDPNGAAVSNATLAGQGCDENCLGEVTPDNGLWFDWDQLGRHAFPGECFLIRVGSFPGGPREVNGQLIIDCLNTPPPPLQPDPTGLNKSRFISFEIPSEPAGETAIRVKLTQLHRTNYYCDLCYFPFTPFEGLDMWVGPSSEYVESSSTGTPFLAATAQCTPHYRDWSTVGLLHITGTAIVPGSTYHVEQVASACMGREQDSDCQPLGANVSSQLQIRTTRWADVVPPFNPPAITVQPDLSDVSALLDKFRSAPGSPIKARALLAGIDGFGSIDIATDFGFQHISVSVDAFRGAPYPHRMGRCATGGGKCTFDSNCIGPGSAPPCELYCP